MKSFSDPAGRFIIVDISTENKTLTLVNIYAPNKDDPDFFEKVFNHLLTEELILSGDFNLVFDVRKDNSGSNPVTHEKCLEKVKYIMDSLDRIDIWRVLNSDAKRFPWRRRKPDIQCRLDCF